LKNSEQNSWLLIKHRDEYATDEDVTKKDKSVVSGKTLEKVEKTTTNFWGSNKKASKKKTSAKKSSTKKKS
jgi:bifunctional non-homologous end joining protein LigD